MMGYSKMLTKGNLSGFVPDYRHTVDTSEGFSSSGRFDTQLMSMEDSFAPLRKYNFSEDGYDNFGVPLRHWSISSISRSDRKDLNLQFRMELNQVRAFMVEVTSFMPVVRTMPAVEVHSLNGVEKKLPVEGYRKRPAVSHGKKRVGPAEPHIKTGHSRKLPPVKSDAPSNASNDVLMKQCGMLLNRIMSHQYSWVFNNPVDPVALNLPDYFSVIKQPMDLGTVKHRVASGEYSPLSFAADVRLTFTNAMTYNPPSNDVHLMAKSLSKMFEKSWKSIEKKLSTMTNSQFAAVHENTEVASEMPALKKKKTASTVGNGELKSLGPIMTDEEKLTLSRDLEAVLGELPDSIVDFLRHHCSNAGRNGEDEIEIDIDVLGNDTLFQLRELLDDHLSSKQRIQSIAEPCEIELAHEPGISNSPILPCKDERIDDDIDIDDNDTPLVIYHSDEIQEDGIQRNSKCSRSNSVGSSSEVDGARALVPVDTSKVSLASVADADERKSVAADTDNGDEVDGARALVPVDTSKVSLASVADADERKSVAADTDNGDGRMKQSLAVTDDQQEDGQHQGESTISERQVSPEKLYRAALLRSRFADTILKAQEKTLEKGETKDPEKLRMEREELERHRKEEKARLQVEAKAAEEAQRKAETEAADRAKMQRDLEREAARQALLKMEKTVEINENSQFMEDLEILTSAAAAVPSSLEERSLEHALNDLGSFKLEGVSNPLEQLGLYMKADDEEDDEDEGGLQSLPNTVNDVEDGEIN